MNTNNDQRLVIDLPDAVYARLTWLTARRSPVPPSVVTQEERAALAALILAEATFALQDAMRLRSAGQIANTLNWFRLEYTTGVPHWYQAQAPGR